MKNIVDRRADSALLAARAAQVQRGGARAAVLGVNDGLVSVLCIVLAVAGAAATNGTVLLAGLAGLIAGAISMAVGEWISVQSQVELFQGVLGDVKHLVKHDQDLLVEELQRNLETTGVSAKTAQATATELARDKQHFYDFFVSRVIGINPDELGSPWVAAGSSFALFTLGALAPILPWVWMTGTTAVYASIVFTALGSLLVGGYVARSSGNPIAKGAIRQLLIVIVAAVVTYGLGHIFGQVA